MDEINFCPRCGKRATSIGVHTCSPQSTITVNDELRARIAALLALLDSCADMLPPCGLRDKVHAVISESGEWNPELEVKYHE